MRFQTGTYTTYKGNNDQIGITNRKTKTIIILVKKLEIPSNIPKIDLAYGEYSPLETNSNVSILLNDSDNKSKGSQGFNRRIFSFESEKPRTAFVRITPRQLDRHHKAFGSGEEEPRVRRYYPVVGRYFSPKLDVDNFREALEKSGVNMERVDIIKNPDSLIIYQYEDKPLIALDVRDGNYYTTQGTLEHYDLPLVEFQAYILTSILRKQGLSPAIRRRNKA